VSLSYDDSELSCGCVYFVINGLVEKVAFCEKHRVGSEVGLIEQF
jgi:hypothetical protein